MPKTHTKRHELQTLDGFIDVLNPAPEDISLSAIATALSRICRFNGHTSRFYSVAEHSLHCLEIAKTQTSDPRALLSVLLHDAPEAYLGDYPGPLVRSLYFFPFRVDWFEWMDRTPSALTVSQVEGRLMSAIFLALFSRPLALAPEGETIDDESNFLFYRKHSELVTLCDLSALEWERKNLFSTPREWLPFSGGRELLSYANAPAFEFSPEEYFLDAFYELKSQL